MLLGPSLCLNSDLSLKPGPLKHDFNNHLIRRNVHDCGVSLLLILQTPDHKGYQEEGQHKTMSIVYQLGHDTWRVS